MTIRDLVARLSERLATAGVEAPRAEAWLLLAAVTGRPRAALIAGTGPVDLSDGRRECLDALVARRCCREPMAYVLGQKEFWSQSFAVGPGVLVPRPETETVVEAVLNDVDDRRASLRVLDLGTGSGCLLLALLSELPNATGTGVDASRVALDMAARNARLLDLAGRVRFVLDDWGAELEDAFELIVTNPPYVAEPEWLDLAPEIRDFEPRMALVAGPEGLDAYRALAPHAARLLAPDGILALEIGRGQGDAVAAILARHRLEVTVRRNDLAGIERCLVARHRW